MKRIISLILAIMMIASFAVLSVSADEIKTIDATGGAAGENKTGLVATVTKKYFAVSYTMVAASAAGAKNDNGCCGLYFNDIDDNCIFIPYEEAGTDTQRGLGIWGGPKVVYGKWWGTPDFGAAANNSIADYADKEVTILVLGEVADGNVTVTCYINGNKVTVWGDQESATAAFNGKIQWATKLSDHKATVKFTESDTALDKTVFDQAPVTPDQPDEPVAPKTGEATAIVALVSVLALAGVVVASKKRA